MRTTFPSWNQIGTEFVSGDEKENMNSFACSFMAGFDLPRFDIWASALPADSGIRMEMFERRALAIEALSNNNMDAAFRHLEWMLNRQRADNREQFLLPLAQRDEKRQAGTKKPRKSKLTEWIESKLSRDPGAKSPQLWADAPQWIEDQIGEDRFKKRVTAARKKLKKT
jgi:hypothetical protein